MTYGQVKNALGKSAQSLMDWRLRIIKSPQGISIPETFSLRVKEVSPLPVPKMESAKVELSGHKFTGATKTDLSGETTLTVYEGVDALTQSILKQIANQGWGFNENDVTGNQAAIEDRKMTILLELMQNDKVNYSIELRDALMSLEDRGSLGQDLALQELKIKVEYDTFYEN